MKLYACILILCCGVAVAQRPRPATTASGARSITIVSEPAATIWIDEIKRGVTDDHGALSSLKLSNGAHTLRARAMGFKEMSIAIPATQRGRLALRFPRPTEHARLLFPRAETARET